jgi:hypothetical protein
LDEVAQEALIDDDHDYYEEKLKWILQ